MHLLPIFHIEDHIYCTLPPTLLPKTFFIKALTAPSHDLYILVICSETS